MHLFDLQIPFFLPLWRRVALVFFCLGWSVIEFVTLAPFWGIVFGGLGVFAAWQFFFSGWPENSPAESALEKSGLEKSGLEKSGLEKSGLDKSGQSGE